MSIYIKPYLRLIILVTIFLLQFLSLVIHINSLATLNKEVTGLQLDHNSALKDGDDYYNKKVKDIKQDLSFRSARDGYEKTSLSELIDLKDILVSSEESDIGGSESLIP